MSTLTHQPATLDHPSTLIPLHTIPAAPTSRASTWLDDAPLGPPVVKRVHRESARNYTANVAAAPGLPARVLRFTLTDGMVEYGTVDGTPWGSAPLSWFGGRLTGPGINQFAQSGSITFR